MEDGGAAAFMRSCSSTGQFVMASSLARLFSGHKPKKEITEAKKREEGRTDTIFPSSRREGRVARAHSHVHARVEFEV